MRINLVQKRLYDLRRIQPQNANSLPGAHEYKPMYGV